MVGRALRRARRVACGRALMAVLGAATADGGEQGLPMVGAAHRLRRGRACCLGGVSRHRNLRSVLLLPPPPGAMSPLPPSLPTLGAPCRRTRSCRRGVEPLVAVLVRETPKLKQRGLSVRSSHRTFWWWRRARHCHAAQSGTALPRHLCH